MEKYKSLFCLWLFVLACSCNSPTYDLILRNGKVYDGTGADPIEVDIAIKGNRIQRIQKSINAKSNREIDLQGIALAPGFVDLHAHIDPIDVFPQAESHLRQGVTTALGGPDGSCPLPFGPYLDSLASKGVGMNVAYLVGHNTVRANVMGMEGRDPSSAELETMKTMVDLAMKEGAFGISTGLKYLPGVYSKTPEVIALSAVAASHGGFYTTHMREEGLGLLDAVAETITIGAEAKIPVVLTHHKVVGQPMWGASKQTLAMVDSARAIGIDVMIDQYPYTASFTSLSILIPAWAKEGGAVKAFAERCKDPMLRDSIKKGIEFNIINDRGGNDLRRVQFSIFDWKPELAGKTLYDWAIAEGLEPTPWNGAELVIQAQLHRGARCIFHAMEEADVIRIMQHPQTMIASDGRLTQFEKGHPHPRVYGTFPRVLGYFSRDKNVLPLASAIHKMTGLPAKRMGLVDRGLIKEGYYADLTIFDPDQIIDKATFEQPHQYPEGIHYVIVNGEIVVENGTFHDLRSGMVLRKQSIASGK